MELPPGPRKMGVFVAALAALSGHGAVCRSRGYPRWKRRENGDTRHVAKRYKYPRNKIILRLKDGEMVWESNKPKKARVLWPWWRPRRCFVQTQ